MIGIIVAGHGSYASGISSSVNQIAGLPEKYETVDFLENDSDEDLLRNLNDAVERLSDCDGVIIFTDLIGGLPYKIATEISRRRLENIQVIGGTNLGMIIEIAMTRGFVTDIDELVEMAVITGKDQIMCYAASSDEIEKKNE